MPKTIFNDMVWVIYKYVYTYIYTVYINVQSYCPWYVPVHAIALSKLGCPQFSGQYVTFGVLVLEKCYAADCVGCS